MLARGICTILLCATVFLFPWWTVVLLLVAALFYFPRFYEAIGIGLLLDSVYATHAIASSFPYLITLGAIVLVILIQYIRARLIMY